MANGNNYTKNLVEIHQKLSSLETISQYQENHLSNIDKHLNKLNERTEKTETRITVLETERKMENPVNNPSTLTSLLNKGKTPGIVIGITGIIFSSIYALGQVLGWWG